MQNQTGGVSSSQSAAHLVDYSTQQSVPFFKASSTFDGSNAVYPPSYQQLVYRSSSSAIASTVPTGGAAAGPFAGPGVPTFYTQSAAPTAYPYATSLLQQSKTSITEPEASSGVPAPAPAPVTSLNYPQQQQYSGPLSTQYSGGPFLPGTASVTTSTGFKDSANYMAAGYGGAVCAGAISGLSASGYFDSSSGSDYVPSASSNRAGFYEYTEYQPSSNLRALSSSPAQPTPAACSSAVSASAHASNGTGIAPSNGAPLALASAANLLNTNDIVSGNVTVSAPNPVYSSQLASIYKQNKPSYATQRIPVADQNLLSSAVTNSTLASIPYYPSQSQFSPHGANLSYYSGGDGGHLRQYSMTMNQYAMAMPSKNSATLPDFTMLPSAPGNFVSAMAGYASYAAAGGSQSQSGELLGSASASLSLLPPMPILTHTAYNEPSIAAPPPLASPFGIATHELHVDAAAANKTSACRSASGPHTSLRPEGEGELATAASVAAALALAAPLTYSSTSNSDALDSLADTPLGGDDQSQAGGKQLKRGPESIAADEADLPPEVRAERERQRRQANNFRERYRLFCIW